MDNLYPVDLLEVGLKRDGRLSSIDESRLSEALEHFGPAIEVAAIRWLRWMDTGEDLFKEYPNLVGQGTLLDQMITRGNHLGLLRLEQSSEDASDTPADWRRGSLMEVPSTEGRLRAGTPFMLWQERISKALQDCGLERHYAYALIGAFRELTDNALEHANSPVPPVAGFQLAKRRWMLSVTDVGRGALASLRNNPQYSAIRGDLNALRLVLQDSVSSSTEKGRGQGFRVVFKALADRHVALRFRTGGAAATWSGSSPTAQNLRFVALPLSRGGFHISLRGRF